MSWEERSFRAEDYCNGYCDGFHEGRSASVLTENFADDDNEHYRSGFRRGFAARRIIGSGTDAERKTREPLYEEVDRMDRDYAFQGERFTDEQWKKWKALQSQVKRIGNESWEDVLLETYRLLNSYAEGTKFSEDEQSSALVIRKGILTRLARTLPEQR